jgi:Ca-activated chloride channel family protein
VHRARPPFKTEGYDRIRDNPFRRARDADVSTFSIDVDTASYANVRRHVAQRRVLPPKDAVRIEELLNYFPYAYEPPAAEHGAPFRTHVQVVECPWNPKHRLARIALKGKVVVPAERPRANLVFLLDVSGSMEDPDKLPLLKEAMAAFTRELRPQDRVAIVVYAGAAGLVLPSTPASQQRRILRAIGELHAGGSTNGAAGLVLAYQVATQHFVEDGVNRVILATDGDFNVGVSSRGELVRLIEAKAKTGVYLSILGFGMGNYKDDRMEEISNRGNGNYAYIDTLQEARKVLVQEASSTLVTIAKDVKIQVFFNPARVAGYRLIGYENRILAKEDFNDDKKDAGEIGAGHAVTALYELVPAGLAMPGPGVDPNPFVRSGPAAPATSSRALFRLRLRYKQPDGDTSTLLERDVHDSGRAFAQADRELQWAAAVAAFGMLLRDSPHKGDATWDSVIEIAGAAVGVDPDGYRREFLALAKRAKRLALPRGGSGVFRPPR